MFILSIDHSVCYYSQKQVHYSIRYTKDRGSSLIVLCGCRSSSNHLSPTSQAKHSVHRVLSMKTNSVTKLGKCASKTCAVPVRTWHTAKHELKRMSDCSGSNMITDRQSEASLLRVLFKVMPRTGSGYLQGTKKQFI